MPPLGVVFKQVFGVDISSRRQVSAPVVLVSGTLSCARDHDLISPFQEDSDLEKVAEIEGPHMSVALTLVS